MAQITQEFLDSLGAGESLRRYPVDGHEGLLVQVTPAGVVSWVFRARYKGDRLVLTIGKLKEGWSFRKAKDQLTIIREQIRTGVDPRSIPKPSKAVKPKPVVVPPPPPPAPVDTTPLFRDVAEDFYRDWVLVKNAASTAKYQRWALDKHVLPALGDMKAPDVTIPVVSKFLDSLAGTPTTANRVKSLLSKLFNWSRRRYPCLSGVNPAQGHERHEETPREIRLTEDEIRTIGDNYRDIGKRFKLIPGGPAELRHALLFLMLTGARSGVVLCETPENRFPDEKMLRFDAKAPGLKGCRAVFMCNAAVKLLPEIPYNIDRNALWHAWEYLRPDGCVASLHDLRRTFASIGADLGHDEAVVDALLGHSRGKIRDTYFRRADPTLLAVAESIGGHIAELLGIQKPAKKAVKVLKPKK